MIKRISSRGAVSIILWFAAAFTTFSTSAQDWQVSTLHSFGNLDTSAYSPDSGIVLAEDMKLYGTTFFGGSGQAGEIFRINRDGSGYEVLHDFGMESNRLDGASPLAGVLAASDGLLYGTTIAGGTNRAGIIYSLNRDGSDFRILYQFERLSEDDPAPDPYGELIEGQDGMLYGTTRFGGQLGEGAVFRLNKDGTGYEELHAFDIEAGEGGFPECPLIQGSDGMLYGTANDKDPDDGSVSGPGKIFRLRTDGSGYEVIHDFGAKAGDGSRLLWGLTEGRDGTLYGTTLVGGTGNGGILFNLRKDGSQYQILYNFGSKRYQPSAPFGPLRQSPGGLLYGATGFGGSGRGGTLFVLDETTGLLRILDSFGEGRRDAVIPIGALALDSKGILYGTSQQGGVGRSGTVFRWARGRHEVLHNFNSTGGDGAHPTSPPFLYFGTTNFLIFGTTIQGGFFNQGTAYQMNYDGTGYKVLRNFADSPVGLVADSTGSNLYVTTLGPGVHGHGALYRMKRNGKLKLLHVFRGGQKDGASPGVPFNGLGGTYQSQDGMLYGVTSSGGMADSGVLYRIREDGEGYVILHQFDGSNGVPGLSLMEGSDGALYGTTTPQLGHVLAGSAFKINRDGSGYQVLHTFNSRDPGGPYPAGPLIEGGNGVLYGATENNFLLNPKEKAWPVLYQMNIDGSGFSVIHTFTNYNGPVTGLVEENDGELYGFTSYGGEIFRLQKSGSGFEVIGSLDLSDDQPTLVNDPFFGMHLLVTTSYGGYMRLGEVIEISPP